MPEVQELRHLSPGLAGIAIERRAGQPARITGYASVFFDGSADSEFRAGPFVERIHPKAFDRALKERQNVVALFNHEPSMVLGRTKSGTLRLSVDKVGLKYDIDLPATQVGRDVLEMVSRGDVEGSSFSFYVRQHEWTAGDDGEPDVRLVTDVDVIDVGPVTLPAYKGSSVEAATRDHIVWLRKMRLELAELKLKTALG